MTGAVMNHVWQSTLFAAAAGLLTAAFRRDRAQVRYGLWLCASCKFLLPFSLLIGMGSRLEWRPAAREAAGQITIPAVSETVAELTAPFSERAAAPARGARDWPTAA